MSVPPTDPVSSQSALFEMILLDQRNGGPGAAGKAACLDSRVKVLKKQNVSSMLTGNALLLW